MDDRFDRLETMIGALGGQLRSTEEKLGGRMNGVEQKIDGLASVGQATAAKLDATAAKLDATTAKLDATAAKVDATAAKLEIVAELGRATAAKVDVTATRVDTLSHQLAGVSTRIDGLTRHQKQFATDVTKRLKRAEAKAQITIEGHEAIRSEMRKAFAQLRWDINNRVQPIEVAVRNRK